MPSPFAVMSVTWRTFLLDIYVALRIWWFLKASHSLAGLEFHENAIRQQLKGLRKHMVGSHSALVVLRFVLPTRHREKVPLRQHSATKICGHIRVLACTVLLGLVKSRWSEFGQRGVRGTCVHSPATRLGPTTA